MTSSIKDFLVLGKLGEGSFSQVFKGIFNLKKVRRISDDQEYALKKVKLGSLSSKEKENALNEVRILASIQSPYIISYKDAFYEEQTNCLSIIMEFAQNGDLLKKITNSQKKNTQIPEEMIWKALYDMTQGLKKLHNMKILHRDLKCANIFIGKDDTYKLGDLNVSKVAKQGLVKTQTGTPYYCSPEVWSDQPYDSKCDIWSLGCILYEMAALKPPFRANDMRGLYNKIMKGVYERIPNTYSQDLHNIIASLLKVNPKLRPSSDDLLNNQIVIQNTDPNQVHHNFTQKIELLNTIKIPHNLKLLQGKLPQSQYNLIKSFEKKQEVEVQQIQNNSVVVVTNQVRGSSAQGQKKRDENLIQRQIQITSEHQNSNKKKEIKEIRENTENKENKPVQLQKPPIQPNQARQNKYMQDKKQEVFQYPQNVKLPRIEQSPSQKQKQLEHDQQVEQQNIRQNQYRAYSYEKNQIIAPSRVYDQNIFQRNDNYKKQSLEKNERYPSVERLNQYVGREVQHQYQVTPQWWG